MRTNNNMHARKITITTIKTRKAATVAAQTDEVNIIELEVLKKHTHTHKHRRVRWETAHSTSNNVFV